MRRMKFSIAGLMGFVVLAAIAFAALKASSPIWASVCYSLAFVVLVAGVLLAIQSRGRSRAFWLGFSITGWAYFTLGGMFPNSLDFQPPPRFLTAFLVEKAQDWILTNPDRVTNVVTYPAALPPAPPAPSMLTATTGATSPTPTPTDSSEPVPAEAAPSPPSAPVDPVFSITGTLVGSTTPAPATTSTPSSLPTTFVTTSVFSSATVNPPPNLFSASPPEVCFGQIGESLAALILAYVGGLFSLFLAARRERNEANPAPTAGVNPSSP